MQPTVVWDGDTMHGHYQVVDCIYDGRPARVLYSGNRKAAQSGIAKDDRPDLLFDYIQRMYELVTNLVPDRLLIIGGGVGTLAVALLRDLPELRIDMVEPDEGLARIGYDYFGLPVDERLNIYHVDGRTFLREQASRYDMVLVDAFSHTTIPNELKTLEAFQAYAAHLGDGGILTVNVISGYYGPSAHTLQHMYAAAVKSFETVDIFLASHGYTLWLPQNFLLTGQRKGDLPLQDYVRYESVSPPYISTEIVLRDE